MKEKDIQREFGNAIKQLRWPGVFELKLTKTRRISFDSVREHQVIALMKVSSNEGVYHKVADQTIGRQGGFGATLKKPFDCFFINEYPGYIVIAFYEPIKKKVLYGVPIKAWVSLSMGSAAKSATEEEIADWAVFTIDLKRKFACFKGQEMIKFKSKSDGPSE